MKQDCNVLLLNKSLKELLCLSIQGLQLQSCILSHTPPLWSCMLRVKFILEKILQSFLDFDHRSYIVVLSDMIPFFNPHSAPRPAHYQGWSTRSPGEVVLTLKMEQITLCSASSWAAPRANVLPIPRAWRNVTAKGWEGGEEGTAAAKGNPSEMGPTPQ